MSKESIQRFCQVLKDDDDLNGELQAALEQIDGFSAKTGIEVLVDFAGRKGFSFTVEEYTEYLKEPRELSPEILEQIQAAGGQQPIKGNLFLSDCITPFSRQRILPF